MKHFLLLFCSVLLYGSCVKKADIPSYIHIEPFVLTTDNATQGTNAANITDVWLYVDNKLQGVYPLPCTVPVIASGNTKVAFRPGIKKNGTANDRTYYPFYSYVDTTLFLEAEKITNFTPNISYIPNLTYTWLENFETSNISLKKTTQNQTIDSLQICSDPNLSFQGGRSGRIVLTHKGEVFEYASKTSFTLPGNGKDIYMELNYKSELPMVISFYDKSGNGVNKYESVVTTTPTTQWKKIYIYLSEEISHKISQQGPTTFSFYFNVINDADQTKEVMLDNIKLITR